MWKIAGVISGTILALAGATRASTPITIMSLGDSITAGTVPGGYRKPMFEKLEHDYGLSVIMLGTQVDASLDGPHQHHEGHGGWRIDQLADNLLGANARGRRGRTAGTGWTADTARGGRRFTATVCYGDGGHQRHQPDCIGNDPSAHPMSGRSDADPVRTVEDSADQAGQRRWRPSRPEAIIVLLGGCIPVRQRAARATS